jgi:hypothetical protein
VAAAEPHPSSGGLGSKAALVMGLATAGLPQGALLISGTRKLLAGTPSMASSEHVFMRSQREFYECRSAPIHAAGSNRAIHGVAAIRVWAVGKRLGASFG